MAAQTESTQTDVDAVAIAGAEALAALENPSTLAPRERVRFAIERAVARTYDESRRAEAAAAIRDFARVATDMLLRFEYAGLDGKIENFRRLTFRLETTPMPPPPTERDKWEKQMLRTDFFADFGRDIRYQPSELESLWRALGPRERITGFDVWGVSTTARNISRRELRLGTAPQFKTLLADWSADEYLTKNFAELPRR